MSYIYAVNKTNTHISLKAGYTVIPADGFKKIHKDDRDHPDFRDAESREWIEYSNTEPEAKEVKGPKIITASSASQGMSEDELKEMLSKAEDKKPVATVTQLGQQEDKTEPPTESAEVESDAAPAKTGRKAK